MTFRDIAEKGKPETDNLIVLKIVLRCQNSSHTFSNLFNKKPEDSHLSDVSWTLEHLFLGLLTFWLKGSGGPVRSNLWGLFKDVLPKISRAETEYNVDIWPGGRGAMPPTLPNAVWHEKSPQFGRGSWSEHIRSTNWLTLQENIHSSPEIQAGVCKFDIIQNGLPGPGLMAENRLYSLLIDVPQV